MKIQTSHFKGQFLFLLGLTIPTALMSGIYPAQANPSPSTTVDTTIAKPFIDSASRYDSLKGLQAKPIGGGINTQDAGKTKESSDKGKDSSDKGKEGKDTCDSGNCGGLSRPGQEITNPGIFKQKGMNIRSQLPNQLLTSQQPII